MFGIDSSELFVIGLVALLVIGPQRLPLAMRTVGQWVAKGRAMTRHVRSGFDAMVREAELEEMQKAWAKQNDAIMKATAMDPTAFLDPANPAGNTFAADTLETTALLEPEPGEDAKLTEAAPVADEPPSGSTKKARPRRAKKIAEPEPDER